MWNRKKIFGACERKLHITWRSVRQSRVQSNQSEFSFYRNWSGRSLDCNMRLAIHTAVRITPREAPGTSHVKSQHLLWTSQTWLLTSWVLKELCRWLLWLSHRGLFATQWRTSRKIDGKAPSLRELHVVYIFLTKAFSISGSKKFCPCFTGSVAGPLNFFRSPWAEWCKANYTMSQANQTRFTIYNGTKKRSSKDLL